MHSENGMSVFSVFANFFEKIAWVSPAEVLLFMWQYTSNWMKHRKYVRKLLYDSWGYVGCKTERSHFHPFFTVIIVYSKVHFNYTVQSITTWNTLEQEMKMFNSMLEQMKTQWKWLCPITGGILM